MTGAGADRIEAMSTGPYWFALAAFGSLLVAEGLRAWWRKTRMRPTFDQPAWTWNRWFRPAGAAGLVLIYGAALTLAGLAHPGWALALAAAALAAELFRSRLHSPTRRREQLERRFEHFTNDHPDLAPPACRQAFLLEIHPEWGRELCAQIAADCPEPRSLAGWTQRLEEQARTPRKG